MLGLNGVVVKSHGGTDAQGFAHAVDVGDGYGGAPFQRAHTRGACAESWPAATGRDPRMDLATATRLPRRRRPLGSAPPPAAARRGRRAARVRAHAGRHRRPICRETVVTNDELARTRRNLGCVDLRAHRHPPRAISRSRTRPAPSWRRRAAAAALADAGATAARGGRDHPRHRDARRGVPGDRAAGAGGAGRARLRLRPLGGVQRLRLRAVGGRRDDPRRVRRAACW